MDWFEIKAYIEELSGLDRDSLHIYATVAVQLVTAFVIRCPVASIWPWLAALAVALANEYADLSQFETWADAPDHFWQAVELDMWNGMILPTVLMLVARFFPSIMTFQRPRVIDENQ